MFQDAEFAFTPYTNAVTKGTTLISYFTLHEALITLVERIKNDNDKSYYFLYFNKIDVMAHNYGPDSPQCRAEIEQFLFTMENTFYKNLSGNTSKTLFLMTADHGHMQIYPEETIYLNLEFPKVIQWIQQNKNGDLLVPAGTCRDMFLHIKEDFLNEAQEYLQNNLGDKAEVYKVREFIDKGFFRLKNPSKKFLERVGNLVILCKGTTSVWWYQKGRFEQNYKSHHGSLTRQEMEIPFACLAFK